MSPCLVTTTGLTICRPPAAQPLTRYKYRITFDLDAAHDRTIRLRNHPRRQVVCHECRRRRWAKNLSIIAQGWYDPLVFCTGGCAPGRRGRATER